MTGTKLADGWAFEYVSGEGLLAIERPDGLPLAHLQGIDPQAQALLANLRAFADGSSANHTLLWGARGTGKSALVKAVLRQVAGESASLRAVEVSADSLADLPRVVRLLRDLPWRVALFTDDLTLEAEPQLARAVRSAFDGGLRGAPANILWIATANRRQLIAPPPGPNDPTSLHERDGMEDRLALSDRFGLTLGFHAMDQEVWLEAVRAHLAPLGLLEGDWAKQAIQFALARGARSGRTARQFALHKAGMQGLNAHERWQGED